MSVSILRPPTPPRHLKRHTPCALTLNVCWSNLKLTFIWIKLAAVGTSEKLYNLLTHKDSGHPFLCSQMSLSTTWAHNKKLFCTQNKLAINWKFWEDWVQSYYEKCVFTGQLFECVTRGERKNVVERTREIIRRKKVKAKNLTSECWPDKILAQLG